MERAAFRGISREFLPVPGETLAEALEERGMTQKELALRIGRSEAYVSQVVNGRKRISARMAKNLEYALGMDAEFWLNLQSAYDAALAELNEEDGIDEEEKAVMRELHEGNVDAFLRSSRLLSACDGPVEDTILALRRLLGVSALANLENVACQGAFRLGAADVKPNVLGAWILLAMRLTSGELLRDFHLERIPELTRRLKTELNKDERGIQTRLTNVLAEYGIVFAVIPHFRGAPVQGFIAPSGSGGYRLILTIRGGRADRFWFTLFHELGHIANGDVESPGSFVDSDANADTEMERRANEFARRILIDDEDYGAFVRSSDFSERAIADFAKSQNVPMWIAKGRLQRDGYVSWHDQKGIPIYKWAE